MNLIRLKELDSLDRLMNNFFNHGTERNCEVPGCETDLYVKGNELIVEMEIPGINPEKTDISIVDGHYLKIAIVKEEAVEENEKNYHRKEIRRGSFEKYIQLPSENLELDNINANYKNGVLKVTIPKKENEVKRIQISIE